MSRRNDLGTTGREKKVDVRDVRSVKYQQGTFFFAKLTCIVKAVFPTPPSPRTTNLYSVIRAAAMFQFRAKEVPKRKDKVSMAKKEV